MEHVTEEKGSPMEKNNFKEILSFAREKEEEAVKFYQHCATVAGKPAMQQAFLELADEEKRHVKMLTKFDPDKVDRLQLKKIPDLKISDYLVDLEFRPDMDYQELLILAMKREEASFKLYTNMAGDCGNEQLVKLLKLLAQEELRHKNRIQREYDDVILRDN